VIPEIAPECNGESTGRLGIRADFFSAIFQKKFSFLCRIGWMFARD